MYYWAGSVYACQATFFAWANDVLRYEEDSLRAVVIASMNMGSNAINAWWSIVFYGANFAPYFTRGMWAMIAVSIASKSTHVCVTSKTDIHQWLFGPHCWYGSRFGPKRREKGRLSQLLLLLKMKTWISLTTWVTPSRRFRTSNFVERLRSMHRLSSYSGGSTPVTDSYSSSHDEIHSDVHPATTARKAARIPSKPCV